MKHRWYAVLGVLGLLLWACSGPTGQLYPQVQGGGGGGGGGFQGAIFTSLGDGTLVNGNVYDRKEDVYLNGGPQTCSAQGLPDGQYYFQITDPSGSVLLSGYGPDNGVITVSGGFFTAYTGTHAYNTVIRCGVNTVVVQLYPFDDTPNPGGEYKVWLTPVADYRPGEGVFGFLPNRSKTDNFKVRPSGGGEEEPRPVAIYGYKWYDTDTDGVWDEGELPIGGWRIELTPPEPPEVGYTSTESGSLGRYSFLVMPNTGPYTVTEVPPPPGWWPAGQWINTTPTSGTVSVGTTDTPGPNFGNVCLGPGGGRTIGFWSNKNGERAMNRMPGGMAGTLAYLSGLNLVDASGNPFDPTSYAQFRTWLLGANATNMAYMLSAQMAAMALNVRAGFVNPNALVYAPGTSSANPAGFARVGDLINEANAELGAHPTAFSGDPWRSYQEALKDALDWANNNRTFVQPGPEACPFTTPY